MDAVDYLKTRPRHKVKESEIAEKCGLLQIQVWLQLKDNPNIKETTYSNKENGRFYDVKAWEYVPSKVNDIKYIDILDYIEYDKPKTIQQIAEQARVIDLKNSTSVIAIIRERIKKLEKDGLIEHVVWKGVNKYVKTNP